MISFWTALGFLTISPVPKRISMGNDDLGKSAVWFPLIGVVIGGLVALAYTGLTLILSSQLAAALSVALWILLTGGLHMDGLADCCDGMFHASSPERRLEIMKDPRLGAFGAAGMILMIVLKISALASLPVRTIWIALPLAASLARWMLLWAALASPARPDGLGAAFQKGLRPMVIALGAIYPLAFCFFAGLRGGIAILLAASITFAITRLARARLGGMIGDVLGCLVEVVELATLIAFAVQPIHIL